MDDNCYKVSTLNYNVMITNKESLNNELEEKRIKKAKLEKYLQNRNNSTDDENSRKLPHEEEW